MCCFSFILTQEQVPVLSIHGKPLRLAKIKCDINRKFKLCHIKTREWMGCEMFFYLQSGLPALVNHINSHELTDKKHIIRCVSEFIISYRSLKRE